MGCEGDVPLMWSGYGGKVAYIVLGLELCILSEKRYFCGMNRHEEYMRKALAEASLAAEEGEIPVGAVVVCRGRVIARAHNETEKLGDVTAHAEMLAVTMASAFLGGKYLNECTLYVTMEPCTMCAGALAWAQLGELVVGASDPHRGYSRLTPCPLHPRTKVTSGVLAEECGGMVKAFFAGKRGK